MLGYVTSCCTAVSRPSITSMHYTTLIPSLFHDALTTEMVLYRITEQLGSNVLLLTYIPTRKRQVRISAATTNILTEAFGRLFSYSTETVPQITLRQFPFKFFHIHQSIIILLFGAIGLYSQLLRATRHKTGKEIQRHNNQHYKNNQLI